MVNAFGVNDVVWQDRASVESMVLAYERPWAFRELRQGGLGTNDLPPTVLTSFRIPSSPEDSIVIRTFFRLQATPMAVLGIFRLRLFFTHKISY